ncbi:galactosylgalactosylxylosylprotein 3-beta-glucuronosyltransferase 2-like [Haemaphysalis longicornis]
MKASWRTPLSLPPLRWSPQLQAKNSVPTVYVVTPTYRHATQIPDLLRVAQSLMLTTEVFWVLVNLANRPSKTVARLLRECGVPHVLIHRRCTRRCRRSKMDRFALARREALGWLQKAASLPGVLYFADDDNTYHHRLFDEIRWTKSVSVFPVGAVESTGVSSPVVVGGRVIGFHDPHPKNHSFTVDMAGFAFNLNLLTTNTSLGQLHDKAFEKSEFVDSLGISLKDLEPLCENATKCVWTRREGFDSAHRDGAP